MSDYYIAVPHDDYVVHHGVLGQRWGVRRYQNADGSYTPEGKRLLAQHNKNKDSFAYRVGEKRLLKRSRNFEKKSRKYASSFSIKKQEKGRVAEAAGENTANLLRRPEDVKSVGRRTVAGRVGLGAATGATAFVGFVLTGNLGPIGLAAVSPAAIALTKKWVDSAH